MFTLILSVIFSHKTVFICESSGDINPPRYRPMDVEPNTASC